jgi:hypothetical protein
MGISIIIAGSIFGLINLSNNESNVNNGPNDVRAMLQEENPSTGTIKLLNHKLEKPLFSNWKVKGRVQNSETSIVQFCFINIYFLDKNGNHLNSSSIRIDDIQRGEIKNFEVEYKGDIEPDSYKIELSA